MARLRAKPEVYSPNGIDVTRANNDVVLKQYDSMFSKLLSDNRTWKIVALSMLGALALSFALLIYTVNLPRERLVVVSVNDIGETKYLGTTRGMNYTGYNLKEAVIKNILTDYVNKTYTITTDPQYMYNNYRDCMYYLQEEKRRFYEAEINQKDPFSDVGRIRQNPRIETIIPVSDSTYQVDFFLEETDMNGGSYHCSRMRGIFTLKKISAEQYNKLSDEIRARNPLGVYITDYNVVEVEN